MAFLRDESGGRDYPLRDKTTVLGRDPGCDVALLVAQISGRHAAVIYQDAAYHLEDLGSRNGTSLNGFPIHQRVRLTDRDRIELPGLTLTFHAGPFPGSGGIGALPAVPASALEATRPAASPTILGSLELTGGLRVEVAAEAKLRAVLEIANALGASLDLGEVLAKILESLFTIFPQADRGFALLQDPATGQMVPRAVRQRRGPAPAAPSFSRAVVTHALATRRAVLSADAGTDERFDSSESIMALGLRSVMCVPLLSQAGEPLGVIQIDTRDRRSIFNQEDLDVLRCASSQAARAVELARLHEELRDVQAARRIQQNFLPEGPPIAPGVDFFDHYEPAQHVGGDYYDYVPLTGDRLAVALGDVAGKGVSAALLMARLSASARSCFAAAPTAAQAVRQLNLALARAVGDDRFVTFVAAVLDPARFSLTLVNAGHLLPLLRRRDGTVSYIGDEIAGLPLAGIDRPYQEATLHLEPGDCLALYTDGVTEARNPTGDLYGTDRLHAAARAAPPGAAALGQAILDDVLRFAAGRPAGDDLTLVCFGRTR